MAWCGGRLGDIIGNNFVLCEKSEIADNMVYNNKKPSLFRKLSKYSINRSVLKVLKEKKRKGL